MEVPFEIEDEEIIGVQDLKTRLRSSQSQSQHPTLQKVESSTTSFDSSDSSDSSFEYTLNMDVNTITTAPLTNGENPQIIEGNLSQSQQGVDYVSESKEPIYVVQNGESNGLINHENGDGVIEYPTLHESNGGDEDTDNGATTSSSSKSSETHVGLKNVESLFNESSNGVNGGPSDVYNAENIVNKTLILGGQNEIVESSDSQEVEVGVDEYDVEKVIHNQESHDLICPYCHRDVTKRVILKRRKRKGGPILGDAEGAKKKPGLTPIPPSEDPKINGSKNEKESSQVNSPSDGCIDAISCFSCFSIFVPKGDGFLWWKFTPKPAVPSQTDATSAVYKDPTESTNGNQSEPTFPLWILTCCQPYHTEKPVLKPDPKPPLTTPEDELPPSTKPVEENPLPPLPERPDSLTPGPDNGEGSPLWFLTCCQPSENKPKPAHAPKPDKPEDSTTYQPPNSLDPDTLSVFKPLTPIKPGEDPTLPPEKQPLVPPTEDAPSSKGKHSPLQTPSKDDPVKSSQDSTPPKHSFLYPPHQPNGSTPREPQRVEPPASDYPLWFVTCCQPSTDDREPKPAPNQEETESLSEVGSRGELEDDAPSSKGKHPTLQTPSQPPSKDDPVKSSQDSTPPKHGFLYPPPQPNGSRPREPQPPGPPTSGFPLWFVTCCQPSIDDKEPKPAPNQEETKSSSAIGTPGESEDGIIGTKNQHHDHDKVSNPGQSDGTEIQHHDTKSPPIDSNDTPVPPKSEHPEISEPGKTIPTKPLTPIKPNPDTLSPSEPEPPSTPPKGGEVSVLIPKEPIPQPQVILPNANVTGHPSDIEQPLLPSEINRTGVGLDIIKSIVYGGLLECITSLSVITSAAGGDATTLNIVALGLANVFGGLVLLFHNLRVLKHEQTSERYEDQLGRPGHFLLHAIVAILSYLICGLMSPIIYGFSFRQSDNKDYKLATLASASLLCVAILSIGKAYVRRPPACFQVKEYFQTFVYYMSMAFTVSGLGYVAGNFINMLLKKYGVFDSGTEPVAMNEAWSSY